MKTGRKKSIKQILKEYRSLTLDRFISKDEIKAVKRKRYITFTILICVFLLNAIFDVVYYSASLSNFYMTIIMCFIIGIYTVRYSKKYFLPDAIVALTLFVGVSYLSFNGELMKSDILWLFALPTIWFYVVDFRVSLTTSILFVIFYFILFYSNLNTLFFGIYTENFMQRFPIVFLLVNVISCYVYIRNDAKEKESKVLTYIDELTELSNRAYYKLFVNQIRKNGLTNIDMIVVSLDVNSLKKINDNFGHEYGDILIRAASDAIRNAFKNAALVSRIGGDEFVVITYENFDSFKQSCKKLDELCDEFENEKIGKLTISKGYARSKDHPYINPEKLYIIADQEMYKNKSNYYSQNNIDRRRR